MRTRSESKDLTERQREALAVLGDGKVHGLWRRATDPDVAGGRVNNTAFSSLSRMGLARMVDWGSPTMAGTARITPEGLAVLEQSGRHLEVSE